MNFIYLILISVVCGISGFLLAENRFRNRNRDLKSALTRELQSFHEETEKKKKEILGEGKEKADDLLQLFDKDEQEREERLNYIKRSMSIKGETLSRKQTKNTENSQKVVEINSEINEIQKKNELLMTEQKEKLEQKSGEKMDNLRGKLIEEYQSDIINSKEERVKKEMNFLKADLDKTAKVIILGVIQRYFGKSSIDKETTDIVIPKNITKGRLLGKEGRNILFLESLFPNIDFIFNHEPKTLTIAGFNLYQKKIAQLTVKKLLNKTTINHELISQAYAEAKKELSEELIKIGTESIKKMKLKINPDRELVSLVGRLKYRTSYGQNVLGHSMEMAYFAQIIAAEIGCDIEQSKIATFFHDIGKAIDHDIETEEGHDILTKEILEKKGFSEEIVHAAYSHHDHEKQKSAMAFIVKAADAISASRPGARHESVGNYFERMGEIERVAASVEGVDKAYTVSAGREVRLFVNPDKINDEALESVAIGAASRIEAELNYPGKIKVTSIRITKATEVAE